MFYVEKFREAYSIDVFMVKVMLGILGDKLTNPLEFYMANSKRAELFQQIIHGQMGAPDEMVASVVRTVGCILGFLVELAVSRSEEINLASQVAHDKSIYAKQIRFLMQGYFNCETLTSAENIQIFKDKYLAMKMNIDA